MLCDGEDVRVSCLVDHKGKLKTSRLYKVLMSGEDPCPFARFIWKNRAPPRVRFFAWLLVQDKIQSRHNLHKKHVVNLAGCELCNHDEETADHIIFGCATAMAFWEHLGASAATTSMVRDLWNASAVMKI